MADFGLIANALTSGLSQGMDAYSAARDRAIKEKQAQAALALQERQYRAGLAQHGLAEGPGGGYQPTPEEAQKQALESEYKRAQISEKLRPREQDPLTRELGLGRLAEQQRRAEEAQNIKPELGQTALYGKRMQQAEDVFSELEKSGYDRSKRAQGVLSALPGFLQPENLKRQEQAERSFINAVLRRESGAAISPSEFESAEKQYFARAGDTPAVLAQKKRERALAIQGMEQQSGKKAWGGLISVSRGGPDSGAHPPVQQGGQTYNWNPGTGQYE